MTLVIKTGMQSEADVATAHAAPDVLVLTGVQTTEDLQRAVPPTCTAILSFGLCGGLRPVRPVVGQTLIASHLSGPQGDIYAPDPAWNHRLFTATHAYTQPWYSNGAYNTANTPAQRAALYAQTAAWCVDDESLAVARFAKAFGIPFAILRTVSDQWDEDVSITATMLTASGGINIWSVIKGAVSDPAALIRIGREYALSIGELGVTAVEVGPNFGALQ